MDIKRYSNEEIEKLNMDNILYQSSDDENFDYLEISWQPINGCNYQCSYCYGQDPLNKDPYPDLEKMKSVVDQIFSIKKKYYVFAFLGGEITFMPSLIELLKYIDSFDKNIILHILTNGSKNTDYFKKLINSCSRHIHIGISIHLEYAKFDHIKELIELFNDNNDYETNIILMAHPELENEFKNFFNNLLELRKEKYFNLSITEVVEPPDFCNIDRRYSKKYFDLIDDCRKSWLEIENKHKKPNLNQHPFLFPKYYYHIKNSTLQEDNIYIEPSFALRNGLKKFKDFYCCKGIEFLKINYDGTYCGTSCGVDRLYNIFDGINLLELSKPVICPFEQCGCNADNRSPKFRKKQDAEIIQNQFIEKNCGIIISQLKNRIENSNMNCDFINQDQFVKLVNSIAWWIPIRKLRDNFRNKILYGQEQSRAEQSRAEQSSVIFKYHYDNVA
ncbi:radical SAM protein [Brachyspira intermedia]|uniref:radical SAM protein n=1 Tax=Brachyspira intermedia TaxID=84377 RepID=UPI00300664EB